MKRIILTLITTLLTVSVFAADGDLDLSFNGTGLVTVGYGIGGVGTSSAIQPDGKILVGYSIVRADGNADAVVYRYNANGSLDATFGASGIVIFDLNGGLESNPKVLLGADGKIVIVFKAQRSTPAEIRIAVARLNANGSPDATFGANGITTSNFASNGQVNNGFTDAVLQPDGKIAVGGQIINNGFAVARWNADGTVDTAFGNFNGYTDPQLLTSTSPLSQVIGIGFSMTLQPDGKLVIAGTVQQPFLSTGTGYDFGIVRYNPNGSLDTTFGSGKGFVINDFNRTADGIRKIFVLADGKILAGGYTAPSQAGSANSHAFARYNADGSLDQAFGTGGKLTMTLPITPVTVNYFSMALQADGKILLAGEITNSTTDYAIMRLTASGAIDTTFGTGGIARFNFVSVLNVTDLNLQPDGKIIATGRVGLTGNGRTARFNNSSAQPPVNNPALRIADFDGDGKSDVSVFRPANGTWYLQNSTAGFTGAQFGASTDRIVPADYDGDGKTDLAVFRSGVWYLQRSQAGFTGISFGAADDVPVPGDFDGDGKADVAVFRPSNGIWYLQRSQLGFTGIQFGQTGDKPVAADYDGDGKVDVAVNRNGTWFIQRSQLGFTGIQFGASEDRPTPADYDGDGKADVAVFRPSNGTWYLQRSQLGFAGIQFGANGDTPAPGDYDGDGKADVAVFRSGTWYLNRSTGGFTGISFGAPTDLPAPAAFVR